MAFERVQDNAEGISQVLGPESVWMLHLSRPKSDYTDWKGL